LSRLFFPQRQIEIGEMGERDAGIRVANQLCSLDHDRLCGGENNSSRSVLDQLREKPTRERKRCPSEHD
jgi:hypothetical protein